MAGLVGFRLIFKNEKNMFSDISTVILDKFTDRFLQGHCFFPGGRVGFTMSKSWETIYLIVAA